VEGFVYLSEEDLKQAARYVGMAADAFERKYVYRTKKQIRLRKPRGKQCHFLQDGGCAIHPAKPTQCRLFPFWPEYVESQAAWKATARRCPGIGQGPLIQIGTALEIASEMKRAYPSQYEDV
jgi:Fe-S-cluster containining protein